MTEKTRNSPEITMVRMLATEGLAMISSMTRRRSRRGRKSFLGRFNPLRLGHQKYFEKNTGIVDPGI
jgi:hypothetical protein